MQLCGGGGSKINWSFHLTACRRQKEGERGRRGREASREVEGTEQKKKKERKGDGERVSGCSRVSVFEVGDIRRCGAQLSVLRACLCHVSRMAGNEAEG